MNSPAHGELCPNLECDWFGSAHGSNHPCGNRVPTAGEPCNFCGKTVQDEHCRDCWETATPENLRADGFDVETNR